MTAIKEIQEVSYRHPCSSPRRLSITKSPLPPARQFKFITVSRRSYNRVKVSREAFLAFSFNQHNAQNIRVRGCLHDTGTSFIIPVRVHPGSHLQLCIRLHDTSTKCHTGTSSLRFSFRCSGLKCPPNILPSRAFQPRQKCPAGHYRHKAKVPPSGLKCPAFGKVVSIVTNSSNQTRILEYKQRHQKS